jgi:hypothetical protein
LSDTCLTDFAANGTIGARAAVTITSTIVSRCVLRKFAADFVANLFNFLGCMFADRYFASERRNLKGKYANQGE